MAIGTGWAEGAWVDAGWVTEAWSQVANVAVVSTTTAGAPSRRRGRYPRRVVIDGVTYWANSAAHERQLLEAHRSKVEADALVLAITNAPADVVAKAKVKVKRAAARVAQVDTREDEWMQRLRDEDDEILLVLH